MKKYLIAIVFLSLGLVSYANKPITPLEKEAIETMTVEEQQERYDVLAERLDVIKDIPKSSLDRNEKKALRKEVRDIKKEMKMMQNLDGGIYIGGGALIIIILLLILL